MKKKIIGTRREVWDREAEKTAGGLKREDLTLNKQKKIVSKRKQKAAIENWDELRHCMASPFKKGGGRRSGIPGTAKKKPRI